MKRTWVIPAMLVAGVAGLGGLTYAASAQNGDGCGQCYMRGEGDGGWSGQQWRNDDDDRGGNGDRGGNDESGQRWSDRDDGSPYYGPRAGGRGDENCGPRGGGYRGRGQGMHHGYGYGRGREDMDGGPDRRRGYDRREGRGYDNDHGYDRREDRGGGWLEGRRFDRDDSDRGYRGHGYHHRHHQRHDGHDGHDGRGGPRSGRGFDPARLESAKKEIGITQAQEQAWTKYAATLKEVADARKTRRESMDHGAMRRMSTEEHRKFRDAMIQQRRKEQDNVNAAVDELIKQLDEKQEAIAKEVLPGYAFGPWMRGAGMGAGMGSGVGPGMRSRMGSGGGDNR